MFEDRGLPVGTAFLSDNGLKLLGASIDWSLLPTR